MGRACKAHAASPRPPAPTLYTGAQASELNQTQDTHATLSGMLVRHQQDDDASSTAVCIT